MSNLSDKRTKTESTKYTKSFFGEGYNNNNA